MGRDAGSRKADAIEPAGIIRPLGIAETHRPVGKRKGLERYEGPSDPCIAIMGLYFGCRKGAGGMTTGWMPHARDDTVRNQASIGGLQIRRGIAVLLPVDISSFVTPLRQLWHDFLMAAGVPKRPHGFWIFPNCNSPEYQPAIFYGQRP
jgi:hypothetical protein